MSNYLNDHIQAGMLLQVLGPSGNFTPLPRADRRRHLVLLGGGSGITPLISIAETVLRVEPASRISLIYGNRSEADIIFYQRLRELGAAHPERLGVRHVLSEPKAGWNGGVGMLDAEVLARELAALPSDENEALPREFYLCGPEPMMAAARSLLVATGVPASCIHEERFATLRYADAEMETPGQAQAMDLRLADAVPVPVTVQPGQTLLEAGLGAGAKMPFSCTMGGCGACKGRLVRGEVAMPEPNCLTPAERQAGYVLCCVARPRTAVSIEIEKPEAI